jgi:hypothetical protein
MNIIMRTVFGSNLYGTNTPTSDFDYKSVFIPSARDIVLQRAKGVVSNSTKTDNTIKNSVEDIDDELFSLYKLMQMLNAGDMIATELLFVPQEKLLVTSPLWNSLVTNRHLLISKEIKGFKGYVSKQVSKYGVKGSRVAAVRLVLESFDACATQAKIGDYSDYWENLSKTSEFINVVNIPQPSGKSMLHLEVCGRKLPYTVSVKEGINVIQKLFDNYGARALQAENNEGVDWKSTAHAVRVCQQAIELLDTGVITFPRPNAQELVNIKTGQFTFKEISERLEKYLELIETKSAHTSLIDKIDPEYIEDIILHTYAKQVLCEFE